MWSIICDVANPVLESILLTVKLFAPELLFDEIEEHKHRIIERSGLTLEEFEILIFGLKNKIEIVPKENVIEKLLINNVNIIEPLTATVGIDNVSLEEDAARIIENFGGQNSQNRNLKKISPPILSRKG